MGYYRKYIPIENKHKKNGIEMNTEKKKRDRIPVLSEKKEIYNLASVFFKARNSCCVQVIFSL